MHKRHIVIDLNDDGDDEWIDHMQLFYWYALPQATRRKICSQLTYVQAAFSLRAFKGVYRLMVNFNVYVIQIAQVQNSLAFLRLRLRAKFK